MYRIPEPSLVAPGSPSYIDPGLIHDPATREKFQSWITSGVRLKESRPCRRVDCKGRVPSDNICDECGCRQNPRRVRTFVDSVLHFHYDQCPMCGEVAVKIDGCSSVTCPVCKTHYSYQNLSIARPLDRV